MRIAPMPRTWVSPTYSWVEISSPYPEPLAPVPHFFTHWCADASISVALVGKMLCYIRGAYVEPCFYLDLKTSWWNDDYQIKIRWGCDEGIFRVAFKKTDEETKT